MPSFREWKLEFFKDLLERFTKIESSLSIIVQGPLHGRMKESLPYYLDLVKRNRYRNSGNLVISHWDVDDQAIINDIAKDPCVHVVTNKYKNLPRYEKSHAKRGPNPWVYQNHTTHQGLVHATGYFSIKVRSDEIFPTLHLFQEEHLKPGNSLKFLTSDIYFRKDSAEKFHPSDHIVAGLTSRLRRGFRLAEILAASPSRSKFRFPEQLICQALLKSIGVEPKEYKSRKIMQEHFSIVPIAKMQGAVWTASYRKYRAMTTKEDGWVQDIQDL